MTRSRRDWHSALRIARPFDDQDFIYEWKIDGFRGLAFVEDGRCRLVSRNGHTFTRWDVLKRDIAAPIRCRSAPAIGIETGDLAIEPILGVERTVERRTTPEEQRIEVAPSGQ